MPFALPELPYAYDALAPFMSRETLEFHHDKHHLAYVNNANNLMKGTEFEGRPLEDVVRSSYFGNPGLFNNAGQHYNHIHFWNWMKPGGGGGREQFGHVLPIDQVIEKRLEIIGASVSVVDVVRVLPYIAAQDRDRAVDQRVLAVRGFHDLDPPVLDGHPAPT